MSEGELSQLFGPIPADTDGEASHPGPCAAAESQNRVVDPIGDTLVVQPSVSSTDAPATAHTDTQRLIVKAIAKAEANGDLAKSAFLKQFWKINDQHQFLIPKQSMDQTSIHVCVSLAFAASTASHRQENFTRNLVCFIAGEYLADPSEQDGFSDEESSAPQGVDDDADCYSEVDEDFNIEQSVDADVWHARAANFDFDNPCGFQLEEESSHCEASLLEPVAKKHRHEQAMVPTFMGDAGFEEEHLDTWRRAETIVGIVNAAAKAPKYKQAAPTPSPPRR